MNHKDFEKYVWEVIKSYYDKNSIVNHQIESYDNFIIFGLPRIVAQTPAIMVGKKYMAKFGQISVAPPQVIEEDRVLRGAFPADARHRDLNYDAAIHCDITEIHFDKGEEVERKEHTRVMIGRIPVMLKSSVCNLTNMSKEDQMKHGECPNDPGGYFIIKGNERVLTAQLRAAYNRVFVLKQKPGEKMKYIAEVRSMSVETGHSILVQAMIGIDNRSLFFSLPYIKEHIPIGIVFKALGFTDETDITNIIGLPKCKNTDRYLSYVIRDAASCPDQKSALAYIGQSAMHTIGKEKEEAYAWQVVETELFPHLGISGSLKEQACFLGHIVRKLLMTSMGLRGVDDRDNYVNKRVDVAGALLYDIFRNLFKKYTSFIQAQLEKRKQRPDIISIISRIKSITKGLHQCISTGNWNVQKNASYVPTGVSQILDRMTRGATISHLRRVIIPIGKEGKNTEIRQIHPSQFGFVCPSETPEGQRVGIVLNFSLMTKVSSYISPVIVRQVLDDCKTIIQIDDMKLNDIRNFASVYLNNVPIGFAKDPDATVKEVRQLRNRRLIDAEVSVTYDINDNDVSIFCDEGRFIRPLFVLRDNKLDMEKLIRYRNNWSKMVRKGLIQYVDVSEIENSVLAMDYNKLAVQYSDYMEIHPSMMFGVMASIIPFPDHSQAPRNCFQSSMGKQALGIPVMSYNLRTDTLLHVLHYPQQPIVSTRASRYLGFSEMPAGINAIVAIACYTGYNQEDSVIFNYSAIQRGMFYLTSFKTINECEKKRDTYSYERICVPPAHNISSLKATDAKYFKRKNSNYSLLDKNGVIRSRVPFERRCMESDCKVIWFNGTEKVCPCCGTASDKVRGGESIYVKKGDVIIGKVIVTGSKSGDETRIDASRVIQDGEEGFIDRVYTRVTPNGYKLIKVVIRKIRVPKLGDKVASRAAQKGTIGMVLHEKDMPFTANGIVPDIIINPLCIPSRMTVNQLIECALGKYCCVTGQYGDATPFTDGSVNVADKLMTKATNVMTSLGLDAHGWEEMYNGKTGEKMNAKIFIGPTYYQRLKHMVDDKMHARDEGHVTMLTRQPLEGRSRDGGLRFGEMERDCMIAHGSAAFLKERLFDVSDPFQIMVCKKCGVMTSSPTQCQVCRGDNVSKVNFPYASKLLCQELTAMGIKILIRPKEISLDSKVDMPGDDG